MSRYEERLQADLVEIKHSVKGIGDKVRAALDGVVSATASRDVDQLFGFVLGDLPINREVRAVDAMCHAFIARHLPAAQHLRFVSSVLRVNIALERLGDYAVSIGRVSARLDAAIPERWMRELLQITVESCLMLEQAVESFLEADADQAVQTKGIAPQIDARVQSFFDSMFVADDDLSRHDAFSTLSIAARLERVSDQAKNICEEAVFVATGRTKPPKLYKVLFVDRDGRSLAPLATAVARKYFPNSGIFRASALQAQGMADGLQSATEALAFDLDGVETPTLGVLKQAPAEQHVLVALGDVGFADLPQVPFNTAVVRWAVSPPTDMSADAVRDTASELHEHIAGLMQLMRGDDAN